MVRMQMEEQTKLETLRVDIHARFTPATIIEALSADQKPPDAILGAAVVLANELAPTLLEVVAVVASGAELGERDGNIAFYGLHILGAARDVRVFPALMRILRLSPDRLDFFLGDALTQNIARVAIGTFDGDADALLELIADGEVDEYARLEMFNVAAFLAFERRIEVETFKRFLIRFDDERLATEQNMAWAGWENAIALLGLRDLVPRVEAAWKDGRTPEGFSAPKYFYADLKRAQTEWSDPARFRHGHHLGYIEDIADELSWIVPRDPERKAAGTRYGRDPEDAWMTQKTYVNPMRDVGRNDPCPCGSGKKAKRCCLAG